MNEPYKRNQKQNETGVSKSFQVAGGTLVGAVATPLMFPGSLLAFDFFDNNFSGLSHFMTSDPVLQYMAAGAAVVGGTIGVYVAHKDASPQMTLSSVFNKVCNGMRSAAAGGLLFGGMTFLAGAAMGVLNQSVSDTPNMLHVINFSSKFGFGGMVFGSAVGFLHGITSDPTHVIEPERQCVKRKKMYQLFF